MPKTNLDFQIQYIIISFQIRICHRYCFRDILFIIPRIYDIQFQLREFHFFRNIQGLIRTINSNTHTSLYNLPSICSASFLTLVIVTSSTLFCVSSAPFLTNCTLHILYRRPTRRTKF